MTRPSILVLCLLVLAPAAARADPLPRGVVATVEGEAPVTRAEHRRWARVLRRSGSVASRALTRQALQFLLSVRWLRGEAAEQGIEVRRAAVRRDFLRQKRQSFPKHADYLEFLEESGQTRADILLRVETDLLSNVIRGRVTDGAPPVTTEDARRYYDREAARFTRPERRDLRVVRTRTRAQAAAARARIEAGERWAAVARDVSLGRVRLRGLVEGRVARRLDRAVFAARRGELRGPVATGSGWWVFQVTRVRPGERQPFARVRRTIVQLLTSQRQQAALEAFVREFTARWTARTTCREGFRTVDCANGPAPGAARSWTSPAAAAGR